jgi:TetR/AcrR family transcriptional repressor of nem operon
MEARELFRERGYAGMSMQDLAERVGLKKASLYTRFPNKESLVREVLALTLRETFDGLDEGSEATWRVAYETVIHRTADLLSDRKRCVGLHLAYGVSNETPEAAAAVRTYFESLRDGIAGILSHVLDTDDADQVATDALLKLEGATLWLSTTGDQQPMKRMVALIIAESAAFVTAQKR